jgi:hypothetical protein
VRDQFSGCLTPLGKKLILAGRQKCSVTDVLQPRALCVDPIEAPICSYEFRPLALLLIQWSKQLNQHWQLPLDKRRNIMCSWHTVIQRARASAGPKDYYAPFIAIRDSFRVNLRALAGYRVFCSLLGLLLWCLYRLNLANRHWVALLSATLIYVAYRNNLDFSV